jgi:pimeloyl-ACP methyl ester carboxylesterase
MYRGGGFDLRPEPIAVPTLFIAGADDGCSRPELADGQDTLFTAGYEVRIWPGVGHFPHLERPAEAGAAVADWLSRHG